MKRPRTENGRYIMSAVSLHAMEAALLTAFEPVLDRVQDDYVVDPIEAYMLIGQTLSARATAIFNPNPAYPAKIRGVAGARDPDELRLLQVGPHFIETALAQADVFLSAENQSRRRKFEKAFREVRFLEPRKGLMENRPLRNLRIPTVDPVLDKRRFLALRCFAEPHRRQPLGKRHAVPVRPSPASRSEGRTSPLPRRCIRRQRRR